MKFSPDQRRVLAVGASAGLVGGLVSGWAGVGSDAEGLLGLTLSAPGFILHLLVAAGAGALFAVLFRCQPRGYAAAVANGLLFALAAWAVGPLTLDPIIHGGSPTWSAEAAREVFPSLAAHLLYGGLLGFLYFVMAALFLRLRPRVAATSEEPRRTRIVILGGGFGGLGAARQLERTFWRDPSIEVTLVSQSNYLLFTPMLAEVAASALEPQHIGSPVRASLPHTRFRRAEVESVDTAAQVVRVRSSAKGPPEEAPYDHLVIALGSVPHYFGLPGMEANCFTLKTLEDATRLRNHVIAQLEHADLNADPRERRSLLIFAVAGGGFAGTELIAELCDLV